MANPLQLRLAAKGSRQVGREIDKSKRHIGGLEKFAKAAGVAIGIAVAAGIAKIGKAVIDMGLQVDEAMSTVARATGATGTLLKDQQKAMINVFKNTHHDLGTVSATYGSLATSMRGTADETAFLTDQTLKFATVAGGEPTAVAERLGQAARIFGLDVQQSAGLLDTLTKAGQDNVVQMDKLLKSFVGLSPAFEAVGVSADGAAIATAELIQGLGAEKVRSLRTGFDYILNEAGRTGRDAGELFRGYIQDIQDAESQSEKFNLAAKAFGTTAGPIMVEALGQGIDLLRDFGAEAESAQGHLDFTAKETGTLSERFGELKNRIMGTLGEALMPILSNISSFIDNALIPAFTRFTEFASGLWSVFKEEGWAGAWDYIREKVTELKNWFLTDTAVGRWLAGLWNAFQEEGWRGAWDYIKCELTELKRWIEEEWDIDLSNILSWNSVVGTATEVRNWWWDVLKTSLTAFWNWVKDCFSVQMSDLFTTIVSSIIEKGPDWAQNIRDSWWNTVKTNITEWWTWLRDCFAPGLRDTVRDFMGHFTWDNIKNAMVGAFSWAWDTVKSMFSGLINWFNDEDTIGGRVVAWLRRTFGWESIKNAVGTTVSWVWNTIKTLAGGLVNWFNDENTLGGKVLAWVKKTFGWDSIKAGATWVWDGIISGLNFLIDGLNKIPGFSIPRIGESGPSSVPDIGDIPTVPQSIVPTPTLPTVPQSIVPTPTPTRPTHVYPGYAKGGIFTRPSAGIIGEAGPEAVLPLPDNWRSGNIGQNQNVTINVQIDNTLGGGVEAGERVVEVLTDFFQRNPALNVQWAMP